MSANQFERPPVSEWMTPPKSLDLPGGESIRTKKRASDLPNCDISPKSSVRDIEPLHLPSDWSTPPQSKRSLKSINEEPISLRLSPKVSVAISSSDRLEAYLVSDRNSTRKKISLKIRSPKHRKNNRSPSGDSEESAGSNPDDFPKSKQDEIISQKYVPDDTFPRGAAARPAAYFESIPLHSTKRTKTVLKSVLHEFVPPRTGRSAVGVGPSQKSPRKSTTVVKRIEVPDFKAPYALSPKRSEKHKKTASGSPLNNEVSARRPETSQKSVPAALFSDNLHNQQRGGQIVGETLGKLNEFLGNQRNINDENNPLVRNSAVTTVKEGCSSRRNRNIDVISAQNYIREQKLKRQRERKNEKARKVISEEQKKKKLEELRVRTLLLANSPRKKTKSAGSKVSEMGIKISEQEDDLSLGLRQVKPKRSFRESLASLGKSQRAPTVNCSKFDNTVDLDCDDDAKSPSFKEPESEEVKNEKEKTDDVWIQPNQNFINEPLTLPEAVPVRPKPVDDLNEALRRFAAALQEKISGSGVVAQDSNRKILPKESQKDHGTRSQLLTIDSRTVAELRSEICDIAEDVKKLQATISRKPEALPITTEISARIPEWLQTIRPRPHPYNVLTAAKNKLGVIQQPPQSLGYPTDFEPMSSSLQQPSTPAPVQVSSSVKKDSGSDLSSSILDSDRYLSAESVSREKSAERENEVDSSVRESIPSSKYQKETEQSLSSFKENIVLMPAEIRVISNDLSGDKLNNSSVPLSKIKGSSQSTRHEVQTAFNSSSTISEALENVSGESEISKKQVKNTNELVRRENVNHGSFEARIQAELSFLDSLKATLAQMELDRLKTLTEIKVANVEKAKNTETKPPCDDQAVQTSIVDHIPETKDVGTSRTPSDVIPSPVFIEADESVEEEIKTDIHSETGNNSISTEIEEHDESSESVHEELVRSSSLRTPNSVENVSKPDSSESTAGISLQMLNRMIKDEELRSEHQLALIQLRQNTLVDKTKAEMAVLETKKRTLKQTGGESDKVVSVIKKKQRGILLRYQTERQEIERLRRMHEIASEERKIMFKQQKQIHKMQVSTKDMIVKLKKQHSSPNKIGPLKSKVLPDPFPSLHSETNDSVDSSLNHSNVSDFDLSSQQALSEGDDEIFKRNQKTLQERILRDAEKLNKCKTFLGEKEKNLLQQKHFVEEILEWKNRLEDEEKRLREMRKRAMNLSGTSVSNKHLSKGVQDRSTSPFQFQKNVVLEPKKKKVDILSEDMVLAPKKKIDILSEDESIPELLSAARSSGEEIVEDISKASSTPATDYSSETFEAPSETIKSALVTAKSSENNSSLKPLCIIKAALSPRSSGRRPNSSGSDDSANLSHPETASEQSDVEGRVTALHEELRRRKLEAERLKREQKRKTRERLKAKEESLIKQIQAYDAYIEKVKREIDLEQESGSQPIVRPLIKHQKAEKRLGRKDRSLNKKEKDVSIKEYIETQQTDSIPESRIEKDDSIKEDFEIQHSDSVSENRKQKDDSITEDLEILQSDSVSGNRKLKDDSIKEYLDTQHTDSISKTREKKDGGEKEDLNTPQTDSVSENITSQHSDSSTSVQEMFENESDRSNGTDDLKRISSASDESEEQPIEQETYEKSKSSSERSLRECSEQLEDEGLEESPTDSDEVDTASVKTTIPSSIKAENISSELSAEIEQDVLQKSTELPIAKTLESDSTIGNHSPQSKETTIEEQVLLPADDKVDDEHANYVSDSFETDSEGNEISDDIKSIDNISGEEFIDDSKLENIADSILTHLLTETTELFSGIRERVKSARVERITENLVQNALDEAMENVMVIYRRRQSVEKKIAPESQIRFGGSVEDKTTGEIESDDDLISPERLTSEVRRRIHEIMATQMAASPTSSPGRVQTLMKTTYDVSPTNTSPKFDQREDGLPTQEEFISSLSPQRQVKVQVAVRDVGHTHASGEADGQEWFDEDFGLTKSRKEAEQLRLQQLQIEQEIEQLQAQQQDQVPYWYIREIPNKPPPPYTPPGKAATTEQPPPTPTSQSEIKRLMKDFSKTIYCSPRVTEPTGVSLQDPFTRFLWDLAKEFVEDIVSPKEPQDEPLPWQRVPPPISACRAVMNRPRSTEAVVDMVVNRTMAVMGFDPRAVQESLIVRWSRKKRDHVDELLISETQAEESQWVRYDDEIVTVENEISDSLMDALLSEAASDFDSIIRKKMLASS